MVRLCGLALLSLVCLAACENQAASRMIGGSKEHSISLVREQRWFWDDVVEQKLVIARYPECQRRFEIDPGKVGEATLELYGVSDMLYVAHQGPSWYAVGTEECQLQKYAQAPNPVPGTLLGRFTQQDGRLVFEAAKGAPATE